MAGDESGSASAAAVVNGSDFQAGRRGSAGEDQQQLSVILTRGASFMSFSDHIFAAFPFIPSISFPCQSLSRSSIDCTRTRPCFPSTRQLAFCC